MKSVTILLVGFETRLAYSVTVEAKSTEAALNQAWEQSQHDHPASFIDRNKLPIRSSAVGDIFIVDGEYYIVNNNGFVQVSAQVALAWQKIPSRDVTMGWDWCVENVNAVTFGHNQIVPLVEIN